MAIRVPDWAQQAGRMSPLTPHFHTTSGSPDLTIIHVCPHHYSHCQYTVQHSTAPPHAAEEPSLTSAAPTQSGTQREGDRQDSE